MRTWQRVCVVLAAVAVGTLGVVSPALATAMGDWATATRTGLLGETFSWLTDLLPLVLIMVGLGAFKVVVSIFRAVAG